MNILRVLRLTFISAILICCGISAASADNTKLIQCPGCTNPYSFKQAAQWDNNYVQMDTTYTVIGDEGKGSVYVQVSGQWWYDWYTDSYIWYPTARSVDEFGQDISMDNGTALAQMAYVDMSIFGFARSTEIALKQVSITIDPSDDISSFFEVNPDTISTTINQKLIAKFGAFYVTNLSIGSLITVIFPDKSKAVYIKNSGWTYIWTGKAWDKNGRPANQWQTIPNAHSSGGTSGGSGSYITTAYNPSSPITNDWNIWFWAQLVCENNVNASWFGDMTVTVSYVPCRW
jgi:hypothetical protein